MKLTALAAILLEKLHSAQVEEKSVRRKLASIGSNPSSVLIRRLRKRRSTSTEEESKKEKGKSAQPRIKKGVGKFSR